MVPDDGVSRPAHTPSNVVLTQPERQMKDIELPWVTENEKL
jgi:hypothetical protein